MGDLTGQTLVSEVSRHLAGRDDLTTADIITALNLSQTRLARAHDFKELEFSESGTFNITASAASDKIISFSSLTNDNPIEIYSFRVVTADGRSRKLTQLAPRKFDLEIPEPEYYARGTPHIYTMWQDRFELWRVPDEAHVWSLRGTKWPTDLVGSTETSDLDKKDDLLIYLTVSYLYGSLGEYERAGRFFGIFRGVYDEADLEDRRKPDLMLSPVRGPSMHGLSGEPWANPFVRSTR